MSAPARWKLSPTLWIQPVLLKANGPGVLQCAKKHQSYVESYLHPRKGRFRRDEVLHTICEPGPHEFWIVTNDQGETVIAKPSHFPARLQASIRNSRQDVS